MKIQSLTISKYHSSRFWGMAHLHVKNVPHGASRIFLREMTPVCRPHKMVSIDRTSTRDEIDLFWTKLSHGVNVGQVEIEVTHWPARQQLSLRIIKVSHSQVERVLRAPGNWSIHLLHRVLFFLEETYVEIIFQNPFDIHDVKRTKTSERSFNPTFNEEFLFQMPSKTSIRDVTVDLICLGKTSLHHHSIVFGVLTLSKHTDWFPVRKFWLDLEANPNMKLKDRFLFEGNIYDWLYMSINPGE